MGTTDPFDDEAPEVKADREAMGTLNTEASVAGLVISAAEPGATAVAEAALSGAAVGEVAASTALGAAGIATAGVVAAGTVGYEVGSILEEKTHIGQNLGEHIYDYQHPTPVDPSLDAIDAIVVQNTNPDLDAIDTIVYQNPHEPVAAVASDPVTAPASTDVATPDVAAPDVAAPDVVAPDFVAPDAERLLTVDESPGGDLAPAGAAPDVGSAPIDSLDQSPLAGSDGSDANAYQDTSAADFGSSTADSDFGSSTQADDGFTTSDASDQM